MADTPDSPLVRASFTVLGGAISAVIGLFASSRKRVRDAKDTFAVFMSQKLAQVPKRDLADFYQRTKPSIRDEVARIRPFLSIRDKDTIDRLWREYDEITTQELDRTHEGAMGEVVRDLNRLAGSEFQSPGEIIRYYFDCFTKLSA
jgi:hypothetical protein